MQTVKIESSNESLSSQLRSIFLLLKELEKTGNESVVFDFSNIYFLQPAFITMFVAICTELKEKQIKYEFININYSVESYLKWMYFFREGYKPDEIDDWQNNLEKYKEKNYLPILNFPARQQCSEIKDKFISVFSQQLYTNLKLNSKVQMSLCFLISEMTDNIVEHSNSERGFLFCQNYPKKQYIDVCILDRGITIGGSYIKTGYSEIDSDADALKYSVSGFSTKEYKRERGTGLPNSSKIIIEGLKGRFVLISGKAILTNYKISHLPYRWNGTALILRLPKPTDNFNIYDYFK